MIVPQYIIVAIISFSNETLRKVREILLDEDQVKEIMNKFSKETESAGNEYEKNRKERIRLLLEKANVQFEDYLTALKTTKSGYKVFLARDIDETMINNFNVGTEIWIFRYVLIFML